MPATTTSWPSRWDGEEGTLPLFDAALAATGKNEGQARALNAERAWPWKEHAERAIYNLATTGLPFTADDVVAEVGLPDGRVGMNRNNGVGAIFSACAKRGWIKPTGHYMKSRRRSNHSAVLAIWTGDPDHDF
jgi:hypothetical protein